MNENKFKITSDIISKRSLYAVLIGFVVIATLRVGYLYWNLQKEKYVLAEEASKVLSVLFMEHRSYYQTLFINKNIVLSETTLPALPAFSAHDISERFSKKNNLHIKVQTVSDKARNSKNLADSEEQKAINYFAAHPKAEEYYRFVEETDTVKEGYYQYAIPLKIEQKCLKCHGKRESAPQFIQDRYESAYDYKLGEIRGILSIKTPERGISNFLSKSFWLEVFYDIFLFIGLFFSIRYLIYKFKKFSHDLEDDVETSTSDLHQTVSMLDEYKKALDESAIVSKADINGIITYVNDAVCEISGYSREELIGRNHNILRARGVSNKLFKKMWDTLLAKKVWRGFMRNRTKDGSDYYVEGTITPILDYNGDIKEFISVRYNVTELIEKRKEIKLSYTIDKLTALPNRNQFIEDVAQIEKPNIALINIDGFKAINDFYGIASGDNLLKQVSTKLNAMLKHDLFTLYRLHADEFAILGRGLLDIDEFVALVHHYEKELQHSIFNATEDQEITLSVSIGFGTGEQSLVKADMALKVAKTENREYFVYDEALNLESKHEANILMAKRLRTAINEQNIVPYFQPILHIASNKIEKYESLIRMNENGQVIPPGDFLPVAKQTKQYFKLTKTMIEAVLEVLQKEEVVLSVNLSIDDFTNDEMMDYLKNRFQERKCASRIIFELLESQSIENYDEIAHSIYELKELGIQIAIDDFGSGYSNFSHVLQLGADYIKIDGSLIKDIHTNKQSRILVEGIVDFSRRLGMQTIAEFVESEEILDILRSIRVDYAQGYHIAKPAPTLQQR